MLNLHQRFLAPVTIASIEILRVDNHYFVRSTSTDGAVGIANANDRFAYVWPLAQQLIIPYFVGKDARDLETLVDGVYLTKSNYKLAGLALWICVACVELSLFDLLGKLAGKPAGALLDRVIRRQIPVYLSSGLRDTTPEHGSRVAEPAPGRNTMQGRQAQSRRADEQQCRRFDRAAAKSSCRSRAKRGATA